MKTGAELPDQLGDISGGGYAARSCPPNPCKIPWSGVPPLLSFKPSDDLLKSTPAFCHNHTLSIDQNLLKGLVLGFCISKKSELHAIENACQGRVIGGQESAGL